MPIARDALEGAGAPVVELEIRTDDEVLDGVGDEHLAGSGEGADTCSDVHTDTGDVVGSPFDLAGVQTGAHFDAEWSDGLLQRASGTDARPGPSKVAMAPIRRSKRPLAGGGVACRPPAPRRTVPDR